MPARRPDTAWQLGLSLIETTSNAAGVGCAELVGAARSARKEKRTVERSIPPYSSAQAVEQRGHAGRTLRLVSARLKLWPASLRAVSETLRQIRPEVGAALDCRSVFDTAT